MSYLTINRARLEKILLIFILIDILFFPYFQIIIFPLSLPVLLFYLFFIGFNIKNDLEFKMWMFFLIVVILSIFHGYMYDYLSIYFFDNLKYFVLISSSLLYLFFFNYNNVDYQIEFINKILKIFILYVFGLSVFLLLNPVFILELITNIYGDLAGSVDTFSRDLRFTYFFQDANTFAYFMLFSLGFLFHNHRKNMELLLFSIMILFIIILSQSTGGLLGYLVINTLYFFKRVLKTSFFNKVILLIFIGFIFSSIIFSIIYFKDQNVLFSFFYERMFESDDRISSGGGRFGIWSQLFYMFPSPIGIGYNLYIPEISGIRSPHSDFFGFIFRYGFLSIIPVFYFFYKKLKSSYYIMIPALITFFINSLFDSFKLLILFFLLTVLTHKYYLNNCNIYK